MSAVKLPELMSTERIKNRFNEVVGKNAAVVMSTIMSLYNANKQLQECEPNSILGAAMFAVTSNLSISPSLGQAYVVPFRGKATFQIGYRGLIQLAHRTGQYTRLHAGKIYEGELKGFNTLTGEPELGEKISDTVVGYIAYMKLINGFEKYLYMTIEEVRSHAEKYSQSYRTDKQKGWSSSPWTTNFDEMATKTILKKLLNTWGILSTEMALAMQGDQAVVDRHTFTYVDNGDGVQSRDEIYVEADTGEVTEDEK